MSQKKISGMIGAVMTRNCDNISQSFKDKWDKNPDLVFRETNEKGSDILTWILTRNGFASVEELSKYLSAKNRILDAGCGNGRITSLLRTYSPATTNIVGIDLVSADVARDNLLKAENVQILYKDLLGDLSDLGSFDFIYCQEVLHHTIDPRRGFSNLCQLLSDGGEIALYVYKQKGPIREFVDDFVREKISELPYDEAIKVCDQITLLGKKLSEQDVTVDIPNVDILGIKEGTYDLQRFIYHFFMKCFWNPSLAFNANSVINYDWYHPQLCSRHTLKEVRGWYEGEGLMILHEYEDYYGITVRGRRCADSEIRKDLRERH